MKPSRIFEAKQSNHSASNPAGAGRDFISPGLASAACRAHSAAGSELIISVSDRREDEEDAAGCAEKQTHHPEWTSLCERGDRRDSNRDLEHGHAAREDFVLVKV